MLNKVCLRRVQEVCIHYRYVHGYQEKTIMVRAICRERSFENFMNVLIINLIMNHALYHSLTFKVIGK